MYLEFMIHRPNYLQNAASLGFNLHMAKALDLAGKRFGRLLVLDRWLNDRWGMTRWRVLCTCGAYAVVRGDSLKAGQVKCGGKHSDLLPVSKRRRARQAA